MPAPRLRPSSGNATPAYVPPRPARAQALTTYGTEKLSLGDAQELLSQIEADESGMINYVEFVNMMTAS
jgi:hypothetical protein